VNAIKICVKLLACVLVLAQSLSTAQAQNEQVLSRYTITQKGWANTQGGAGGHIVKVNNMASSGPGSIKEA
jgi:hypothetical protein